MKKKNHSIHLPKRIMRWAAAFILAIIGGSIVLGGVAVIYGLATDCPGTAGVYVKCTK